MTNVRSLILAVAMGTTALVPLSANAQDIRPVSPEGSLSQLVSEQTQTQQKLNIGMAHGGYMAVPNQPLTFKTYWNYDKYIYLGEVRIFNIDDRSLSNPLEVLAIDRAQPTVWTPQGQLGRQYLYVLRVYAPNGLYDETAPRRIILSDRVQTPEETNPSTLNIFHQDNTAIRNIELPAAPVSASIGQPVGVVRAAAAAANLKPEPSPEPAQASVPSAKPVQPAPVAETVKPEATRLPDPIKPATAAPTEPAPAKVSPFSISVENEAAATAHFGPEDILMSYDALAAEPLLNVGLADAGGAAIAGENVQFVTYWNYSHWIERAEILVYDETNTLGVSPIAKVEVGTGGQAAWTVPADTTTTEYSYALRVYDKNGVFDETRRKLITITENATQDDAYPGTTPIYGEDNTRRRNIQIKGGTVTVSAQGVDENKVRNLTVLGQSVIMDANGDFAVREIMPSGAHTVDLSYENLDGHRVSLTRSLDIPANDFFFVGIGDLTVGRQGDGGQALIEAGGEDFDQTFVLGRAAFYLKGKVQGKYLITASLDTTEDDISNIFSNLNDRDPESLLRRLDPDKFYPVYGDDSTFVEDAPTQGRFYVRVDRGDDHIVWGNFLTDITSTEFSQIDRGLYGAKLEYNSDETTKHGERKQRLTVFAADPGTVPGRDEFRGTGGSVFFLQQQDLTIGSERLRIEVRDNDSGLVLEVRDLRPFVDYEIDYIQGRVVLSEPLSSTLISDQIVRDGNLSGDNVFLVVRYEFTPGLADIGGFTTGGRGEAWIGDHLRVGFTGQREETGDVDQTLLAADVLLRATDSTYLKGEFANTRGQGFGESASLDGGFTFSDLQSTDITADANAYRIEGALGLEDVSDANGQITGYYENVEAGFSAPGRLAQSDIERFGASTSVDLSQDGRTQVAVKYDQINIDGGLDETTIAADIKLGLTKRLSAGIGARYNDIDGSAVGQNGSRTDIGGQIDYAVLQSVSLYGFGQGSVSRNGTRPDGERYGGGARVKVRDNIQLLGEVSGGVGGIGATGGVTFQRRDGEEYYLNYTLDAERTQPGVNGTNSLISGQNTLAFGGRRRFNSAVSVFGEERRSFGNVTGLTRAFGVDFNIVERWTLGASFEIGEVEDFTQIVDREAFTVTTGYTSDGVQAGAAFEWRSDTINGEVRDSWFFRSNASIKASRDWRALLRFDRAESNSSAGAFFAGEFTEIQVGGAYRPVNNNRLNALLRYTYFEDLAAAQQISNSGQTGLPAQRSHVFSLDGEYQLASWLTFGGKYGLRTGEVSLTRLSDDFATSTAQLGILRADIHVVKKWDALVEARVLSVRDADTRAGILAAVYRHVGENVKIGIGYNFTDFSSDLTDLSFDDNGAFVNLVSKF